MFIPFATKTILLISQDISHSPLQTIFILTDQKDQNLKASCGHHHNKTGKTVLAFLVISQ
jgi:hypothetical protein